MEKDKREIKKTSTSFTTASVFEAIFSILMFKLAMCLVSSPSFDSILMVALSRGTGQSSESPGQKGKAWKIA